MSNDMCRTIHFTRSLHSDKKRRDTACQRLWNALYKVGRKFRFAYAAQYTVNRSVSCRILSRFGHPFELSAAFCVRLGFALQTTLVISIGELLVARKVPHSAQLKCRKRIVHGSAASLRPSHPVASMTSTRKRKGKRISILDVSIINYLTKSSRYVCSYVSNIVYQWNY